MKNEQDESPEIASDESPAIVSKEYLKNKVKKSNFFVNMQKIGDETKEIKEILQNKQNINVFFKKEPLEIKKNKLVKFFIFRRILGLLQILKLLKEVKKYSNNNNNFCL